MVESRPEPRRAGSMAVPFRRWADGRPHPGEDALVVEEPVELRVRDEAVATVMRTPGHDLDLAVGFFFTESWIRGIEDIGSISTCGRAALDMPGRGADTSANIVTLLPAEGVEIRIPSRARLLGVGASCGVCGKRSIDDVLNGLGDVAALDPSATNSPRLRPTALVDLPRRLRERQPLFATTGALHAAGIFEAGAACLVVREDIGRHNAVDKVIGHLLRARHATLDRGVLVVSGRVSFEIVQKALRARFPMIVAVSGVSTLAVDLAHRGGITLCGFTRGESFAAYTHPGRILW